MDMPVKQKLESFFQSYTKKTFKKGETLIRQFDQPEGVFFLTEGIVRMYTISEDGEEFELNIFKPLSFFPVGWLINNSENRYFYDAVTDVEVYIAPKQDTLDLLKREPDIVFDLMKRIYKGLEGYFIRVETLLSGVAYYKTVAEIVIAAHRFGEKLTGTNVYHVKLTHHQIAARTGLSRETVTREIRKLQKKEIVTYEKEQLTIRNMAKLEEELALS